MNMTKLEIEESPAGYRQLEIWFQPYTVEILKRIKTANYLGVLSDAIDWLIQGWRINSHQQFRWEFNQRRSPLFWCRAGRQAQANRNNWAT